MTAEVTKPNTEDAKHSSLSSVFASVAYVVHAVLAVHTETAVCYAAYCLPVSPLRHH